MTKPTESAGGDAQPMAPRQSLTQARAQAQAYLGELGLPAEHAKRLNEIVQSAVDERFGELDDLRIGRVIGSALATL